MTVDYDYNPVLIMRLFIYKCKKIKIKGERLGFYKFSISIRRRASLVIGDGFTSDRGNGMMRRGEISLRRNTGTEFNGGGENREEAVGDCCGHG